MVHGGTLHLARVYDFQAVAQVRFFLPEDRFRWSGLDLLQFFHRSRHPPVSTVPVSVECYVCETFSKDGEFVAALHQEDGSDPAHTFMAGTCNPRRSHGRSWCL